jgi:branched-chain amino acid transport system permease protein
MTAQPGIGWLNFAITLLISGAIGGLVGYGISYVALRLKQEWFLALVLLVGGEIVRILVRGYAPIICASDGLSGIAQPFSWIQDARLSSELFALLVLAFTGIAYVFTERLVRSPYGRLLKAMRENDAVTRSLGKDVTRIRAQVMLIGSVIAAIAGVLFAVNVGFVSTNDYIVTLTLDVWVMIVLGGLGNNRGALLGALLITVLDRATAIFAIQMNMAGTAIEFNYFRYIVLGLILLLMLAYRPKGLLPEPQQTTRAHEAMTGK